MDCVSKRCLTPVRSFNGRLGIMLMRLMHSTFSGKCEIENRTNAMKKQYKHKPDELGTCVLKLAASNINQCKNP